MKNKTLLTIISIIAVIVVLAAFWLISNRNNNMPKADEISVDKVTVSVADVIRKSSAFTLDFTGTAYPDKELDIAAETSGKIVSLNFKLGQSFRKNDIIAVIDDKVATLDYESAKIDAEKLRKEFERVENMYKNGLVAENEYDDASTAYETAKNDMNEKEKQLSNTRVTTSIPGIIASKYVEEGTYVNAGSVIASIVDISKLKVKLNVSESNVYYLKTGSTVNITTDVYPGMEFTGKISFISPSGDDTHNFPVEIEMDNSNENPLKSGTFVNVNIMVESDSEGLYIPREALQGSIKDAEVYVAEDGVAHLKKLLIGREIDGYLEVLSGLTESDRVVISGQVNLSDNKPIKIIENK